MLDQREVALRIRQRRDITWAFAGHCGQGHPVENPGWQIAADREAGIDEPCEKKAPRVNAAGLLINSDTLLIGPVLGRGLFEFQEFSSACASQ